MTRCADCGTRAACGTWDGQPTCADCLPVCECCHDAWAEYETQGGWLCEECAGSVQGPGDTVVPPYRDDPQTKSHYLWLVEGHWAQHGPGGRPEQAKTVRTWSPPEVRERERVA